MTKAEREQFDFGSAMVGVAVRDLEVSVSEDQDGAFELMMWQKYIDAGKPKQVKAWLRKEMAPYFKCVGESPQWVEAEATWPFYAGLPMTFIAQIGLPKFEMSGGKRGHACTIYVFAYPEPDSDLPNAHQVKYHVVEQLGDLEEAWDVVRIIRGPKEF